MKHQTYGDGHLSAISDHLEIQFGDIFNLLFGPFLSLNTKRHPIGDKKLKKVKNDAICCIL
jgi:hypothetical protein